MEDRKDIILVVEDEPEVASFIANVLRLHCFGAVIIGDGQQARQFISTCTDPIHALIVDVVLPKLGGIEVAETFRYRFSNGKIIFITGWLKEVTIPPGAVLLRKPFTPKALLEQVAESLNSAKTAA